MDIKKFVLSYYKNATKDFHIIRITRPQEALRLHCHEYYQVYFVLAGRLVHHTETHSASLSYGDVFIIPPNMPHYIEAKADDVDFYSMSFMPSFFPDTQIGNKLIADFLYYLRTAATDNIQPKFSLPHEDMIFVGTIFDRIMDEFLSEKTGKNEMLFEYVSILLTLFARIYFEQKAQSLRFEFNKKTVMHCIAYIQNHFDEDITLSEIAKRSAMSKTCFCTLFSSITGTSFKNYLNMYRIKKASEMILAGEKLSSVSTLCGYNDFSTFYRNFKIYMSVSPTQYQAFSMQNKQAPTTQTGIATSMSGIMQSE